MRAQIWGWGAQVRCFRRRMIGDRARHSANRGDWKQHLAFRVGGSLARLRLG